ncbi:MAG: serine/threonine protein phosphatase [Clostridiales bacterium]|nr:serine/threonine protein phosphatase [Clostridiales bacterium]
MRKRRLPVFMKRSHKTSGLDKAYRSSPRLLADDRSKIVLMSDCHRGLGSWADDFAKNQLTALAALKYYFYHDYTYIELGDGDELWENKSFSEITAVHSEVFALLARFYRARRLYMVYGNHDWEKEKKPGLLDTYEDESGKAKLPLFPGIAVLPGIRLQYGREDRELFLVHGHQVDFFNSSLWQLSRFLVRHFWMPLEMIGYKNPTSAAKNNKVKEKIERRLTAWADRNNIPLIAGHTHRPVFPEPGEGFYFNDGSCVHPWNITAIEIASGEISLVRWGRKTKEDGAVYIGKNVIGGPRRIEEYFA